MTNCRYISKPVVRGCWMSFACEMTKPHHLTDAGEEEAKKGSFGLVCASARVSMCVCGGGGARTRKEDVKKEAGIIVVSWIK